MYFAIISSSFPDSFSSLIASLICVNNSSFPLLTAIAYSSCVKGSSITTTSGFASANDLAT